MALIPATANDIYIAGKADKSHDKPSTEEKIGSIRKELKEDMKVEV